MMKNKDRFACFIPVKPYVKRYLITNFNRPDNRWAELVNLGEDQELYNAFRCRLVKDNGRFDKRYNHLKKYSVQVAIEISKDDFYRYGWSMSPSEVVSFGLMIERRIKNMLCMYVDVRVALGADISTAIRNFREIFKFTEDDWKYDSIRKECFRHSYRRSKIHIADINELVNKIVLDKLSNNRTISKQGLIIYENS